MYQKSVERLKYLHGEDSSAKIVVMAATIELELSLYLCGSCFEISLVNKGALQIEETQEQSFWVGSPNPKLCSAAPEFLLSSAF